MKKTFTIPQSCHYSGLHIRPHINKKFLQYDVMFDRTSLYNHGDIDQYDINKLFGLSYGHHHKNSVRFGWRCNDKSTPKIEILAYCYIDGVRIDEYDEDIHIAMVDINQYYTYRIHVTDNDYTLTIFNQGQVAGQRSIIHKGLPWYGYQLYPYFGGNKKAPHDINIHFTK